MAVADKEVRVKVETGSCSETIEMLIAAGEYLHTLCALCGVGEESEGLHYG